MNNNFIDMIERLKSYKKEYVLVASNEKLYNELNDIKEELLELGIVNIEIFPIENDENKVYLVPIDYKPVKLTYL